MTDQDKCYLESFIFCDKFEIPAKPDSLPKYWSRDHQSQRLDWR